MAGRLTSLFGIWFGIHAFWWSLRINKISAEANGCNHKIPLGIAAGIISKSNLSASTTYNSAGSLYYGAAQARLRTASFWCGSENGTWKDDWIAVAFGDTTLINGIAMGNRFDQPSEILEEFYLQYSVDGITFLNQTDINGTTEYNIFKMAFAGDEIQYFWFNAFAAKYVRIHASKLMISTRRSRFCARFELFGCNSTIPVNDMLPVGLQNNIIPDSQISASSSLIGYPSHHARLNFPNSWCPVTHVNEWLQVDLGRLLLVTGISTQGGYGRRSPDMVSSYFLSYGNNTDSMVFLQNGGKNKTFVRNTITAEDPVFNAIKSKLIARYIRIYPLTAYGGMNIGKFCLRVEIYAKHPECSADLSSAKQVQIGTAQNGAFKYESFSVGIYSLSSWCATDVAKQDYTRIDLGSLYLVSGIMISGSSEFQSWITSFDARYGLASDMFANLGSNFHGPTGRTEVAVSWLREPRVMRYVEVIPKTFVGNKCFRVTILGCTAVPVTTYVPKVISVTPSQNHVLISIQTSDSPHIMAIVVKYSCINASQPFSCLKEKTATILGDGLMTNTFNLTKIQAWTEYKFTLQLVFNGSMSSETNVTQFKTLEEIPAEAPRNCTISSTTISSITFSWAPLPTYAISGVLTGYQLTIKAEAKSEIFKSISTVNALSHTIYSLDSNTFYSVQIKAVNSVGTGPPCTINVLTLPKAPSAPQNLTVTKVVKSLVHIQWNRPTIFDNSLQYYTLSHKELSSTEVFKMLSPNFTYSYFNLSNQTGIYEFKVRAHTTIPGLWSKIIQHKGESVITKGSSGSGKSVDTFSRNSMIALVTCAGGVMLFALSCILIKAAHEKHKETLRRKRCRSHLKSLQHLTLADFLEPHEKAVDNEIMNDRQKLREFVRERSYKINVLRGSPAVVGPTKYFETMSAAAQTAGRREKNGNNILGQMKPDGSPQQRKIGIDNTVFGKSPGIDPPIKSDVFENSKEEMQKAEIWISN